MTEPVIKRWRSEEPACEDFIEVSKDYWGNTVLGDCKNKRITKRVGLDFKLIAYTAAAVLAIAWIVASLAEVFY